MKVEYNNLHVFQNNNSITFVNICSAILFKLTFNYF